MSAAEASPPAVRAGQDTVFADKDEKEVALPFQDLQDQVTSVPDSIFILSHLCLVSNKQDFSLDANPSKPYEYLRHPNSFAACLNDVCDLTTRAFQKAHSGMGYVNAYTAKIQSEMASLMDILMSNSSRKEAFAKLSLATVEDLAQKCVASAEEIETQFGKVIDALEELKSATFEAKKKQSDNLQQVLDEEEAEAKKAETLEEQRRELSKERQDLKAKLEKAQGDYKQAAANAANFREPGFFARIFGFGRSNTHLTEMTQTMERIRALDREINKALGNELQKEGEILETKKNLDRLINVEQVSHEERISIIRNSIDVMKKVRDRWTSLINFFDHMTRCVKVGLYVELQKFVAQAKIVQEGGDEFGALEEKIMRTPLEAATWEAVRIQHLSACYMQVSTTHFTPALRDMTNVLGLDGTEDAAKIEEIRRTMNASAATEPAQLKAIVDKCRKECLGEMRTVGEKRPSLQ